MKKIDILNYITDFRKTPNEIKTYTDLLQNVAKGNEPGLNSLIQELQQTKVLKETTLNGEKAFQVVTK